MKVLLTTEGTYPYHWGGLSTWCHALMKELPDVDFSLLAVCEDPFATPRFEQAGEPHELPGAPAVGHPELVGDRPAVGQASPPPAAPHERGRGHGRIPAGVPPLRRPAARGRTGRRGDGDGTARDLPLLARARLRRGVPLGGRLECVHGARLAELPGDRPRPGLQRDLAHARRAVGSGPVDLPLAVPALAADRGGRHRARDDGRRLLDGRRRRQARARRRIPPVRAWHLPARVLSRRGRLEREPLREGAEARVRATDHRARVLAGRRDRALLRLQPPLGAADRRRGRADPHRVLRRRPGRVPALRARAGGCTRRRVGGTDRPAEGRRDAPRARRPSSRTLGRTCASSSTAPRRPETSATTRGAWSCTTSSGSRRP